MWQLCAVVGVFVGMVACGGGGVRPEGELFPEDSLQGLSPQQAVGVSLTLLDSLGVVRAELKADTAHSMPETGLVLFRHGVQVRFFRAGQPIGELTADSARIEERTGLMAAFGRVVARSYTEERQLETTELYWERGRQQFFSPAFVRIMTASEIVEGQGFEASQDLRTYRIFHVRGRQR